MIEGVCGVLTWPGLSSVVAGIGTLLAALTALFIYWRNRHNQKTDLASRRRVLHAVLRHQLDVVFKIVAMGRTLLTNMHFQGNPDEDAIAWRVIAVTIRIPNLARLRELQADLFSVGDSGDELVAAYIELCGDFDNSANILDSMIEYADKKNLSSNAMKIVDIGVERVKSLLAEMDKLERQGTQILQRLGGIRDIHSASVN